MLGLENSSQFHSKRFSLLVFKSDLHKTIYNGIGRLVKGNIPPALSSGIPKKEWGFEPPLFQNMVLEICP